MEMGSLIRHGLKFGLMLGILNVVNVQILTWFGLGLSLWVFVINIILLLTFVTLTHVTYKSAHENRLVIKDALLLNLVVILAAAFISTSYMLIHINLIDPEWIERTAEIRGQAMAASGADSAAIEEHSIALRHAFTPGQMYTKGIFLPGLLSFFVAAPVLLFTRSRKSISAR